jgi:hypothetical protein
MNGSPNNQPDEKAVDARTSRAPKVIWAIFGGITVLVCAIALCFYAFFAMVFDKPVRTFANAMGEVLGTTIEVTGSTAVLEKSEIGELALVQRKTQAITKFQTTWLGSEKVLIVRGDFLVKAGFDLTEGGQWSIIGGIIDGPIPQGKVLSVEPIGDFEIYYAENGAINRLEPEDHARAFNHLKNQARRDAERSDIGKEAERVLVRRMSDIMRSRHGELQWQAELLP